MPTEVSAAAEPTIDRGGAHLLWAALTLLAGAFLSLQSRMNGELAVVSGRGLDAALWSFGSGLVLLTLLLVVSSRMRSGFARVRDAVRGGHLPTWMLFGGSVGALYVFNQTYAVPVAGVALFTIAVVGGQTASAIAVDRWGVGPAGKVPVTAARVAAAVLATVGVIIAVGGRASGSSTAVILPIALAVVVGALMTVQQATNGRVNVASGNPFTTTWMNFAVGTVVLLVLSVPGAFTGTFGTPGRIDAPWWAWLGGALGIGVVAISAIAVRHLGVLQVMIFLLFGQLVSAVVLDALAPASRGHISPLVIAGLVTTLVAAILSGVAANRARRHTGSTVAG